MGSIFERQLWGEKVTGSFGNTKPHSRHLRVIRRGLVASDPHGEHFLRRLVLKAWTTRLRH